MNRDDMIIGSWAPAVVILGENPPRHVHRAELVIEDDGYVLHWWMPAGSHNLDGWVIDVDDETRFSRSVHRLVSVDVNGMRGQHDNLTGGDLGVFALEGQ